MPSTRPGMRRLPPVGASSRARAAGPRWRFTTARSRRGSAWRASSVRGSRECRMHDTLGIPLLVAVVALILKALWDLKTAPNGSEVKRTIEAAAQLERRLQQMETDLRWGRDRVRQNPPWRRGDGQENG